jgi:hypothetical protein
MNKSSLHNHMEKKYKNNKFKNFYKIITINKLRKIYNKQIKKFIFYSHSILMSKLYILKILHIRLVHNSSIISSQKILFKMMV